MDVPQEPPSRRSPRPQDVPSGIDAPYEEPQEPEIIIRTNIESVEGCVNKIFNFLQEKLFILKR